MNFKDKFRDLQELVRELAILRTHNLREAEKQTQGGLLLFAEAALTCITLERFLRILPGVAATDTDTFPTLLEKAVAYKILSIPRENVDKFKRAVKDIRNQLLHANFEQAAKANHHNSVEEYFKTDFAAEIEFVFKFTNKLFSQVDPNTGKPYDPAEKPEGFQ